MFFIVGTGRCGTKTLARTLNEHPLCQCTHEKHKIFIKLATDYCHGLIEDWELIQHLKTMRQLFPNRIGLSLYGLSDHKASYLIQQLSRINKKVKFIWLVRNGWDTVSSTRSRGWYQPDEIELVDKGFRLWRKYRLEGDLCGDMEPARWASLTPFEKSCWYWSYTNNTILDATSLLPSHQSIMVRLEELDRKIPEILEFLDLPNYPLSTKHSNKAKYKIKKPQQWSTEEHEQFNKLCGKTMGLLYPDMRPDMRQLKPQSIEKKPRASKIRFTFSLLSWVIKKLLRRLGLK